MSKNKMKTRKKNCENKYENNHENINNCEKWWKENIKKNILFGNQKGELQGLLAANRRKPVIKKEKK